MVYIPDLFVTLVRFRRYIARQVTQPATSQGIVDIQRAKNSLQLCEMMFRGDEDRYQSYNAQPAKNFLEAKDKENPGLDVGGGGLPAMKFC